MKVAILWTRSATYLDTAIDALRNEGHEVLLFHEQASVDAPFPPRPDEPGVRRHTYERKPNRKLLSQAISSFQPNIILASWHVPEFQSECASNRSKAIRVGVADNQWRASLKQRLGKAIAPFHLHRFYDAFFVPGERQAVWAREMGYIETRILRGVFCSDIRTLQAAGSQRNWASHRFLYSGRMAREKGIQFLIDAHEQYAAASKCPWPLALAGAGPMMQQVPSRPSCEILGFLGRQALTETLAQATCFVLASTFEPWCVALHEAACSGLPLICTSEVGSSVHLVQDGYNGYMVTPGSASSLCEAMLRIDGLTDHELSVMGARSADLARQFSPERFVSSLIQRTVEMNTRLRRW